MSRIIDEQLSALLDGELPVEQEAMLLRRLERESGSRDKLARYGLIGELVRDVAAQTSATQVSALTISTRVSAVIAAETTSNQPAVSPPPASSVGIGLLGAGIAASIALVVMFNLADRGNASRVPMVNATGLVTHADHSGANSARLTRYLVSHAQFSNSASRQLIDSHVVMASVSPAVWSSHE